MTRIDFMGMPLDCLSISDAVAMIDERIQKGLFTQHGAINAAIAVKQRHDMALSDMLGQSHIVTADGMSVVWAARLLGFNVPERVAGPELFTEVLALAARRKYGVFFLGGKPGVAAKASAEMQRMIPGLHVTGSHDGYFWDDEAAIVREIRESGAKLLFLGISSPLKERFVNRWRASFGVDFIMGVGGIFDIAAGLVRRAPYWMQHAGLEWSYRLFQEPGRMWRRYLTTNPAFIGMLIAAKLSRTRSMDTDRRRKAIQRTDN